MILEQKQKIIKIIITAAEAMLIITIVIIYSIVAVDWFAFP